MYDIYIKIISLSLCLPVEMSTENNSDGPVFRVVNGTRADLGQFPYQVAIRTRAGGKGPYQTFCGGAIIRETKVLTAAHCVTDDKLNICERLCCMTFKKKSLRDLYVVAATLESVSYGSGGSSSQWRAISNLIVPPGYKFPQKDIALMITKSSFWFNNYVGSLPYASKSMDYGYAKCLVAGYGRVSKNYRAPHLMWAYLELVPMRECSRLHGQWMNRFICTRSTFTDVLQGDSGGPLVCNGTGDPADKGQGVIVGVVSGSREGAGTFFTRVSSYASYIASKAIAAELPYASIIFVAGLLRWLHGHG